MPTSLVRWLIEYDNCRASIDDLPQECLFQPVFNGETLLHIFAMWGYADAVRQLVRRGADVMARIPQGGETPLHVAAAGGKIEICHELVRVGGDQLLNAKTHEGYTARQYAEIYFLREKYHSVTGIQDYERLLKFLSGNTGD